MLSAFSRVLRAGSVRTRVGRREVNALLLKKQGAQSANLFAACWYGKDSAIGRLLGVIQELPSNEPLAHHPPAVSFIKAEQDSLLLHAPDQPENPKVLRVAILGAPNAGKSTLSNQLLGRKVFPVSKKVHTTRCKALGVITDGDTQIILLDTPGMISASKGKRHNLEKTLVQDPWDSMKAADVVLVLVDVSDRWARNSLNFEVLKCLFEHSHIPSILVMNKVDLLKQKGILLEVTNQLTEGIVNRKKAKVKSLINPPSGRNPSLENSTKVDTFPVQKIEPEDLTNQPESNKSHEIDTDLFPTSRDEGKSDEKGQRLIDLRNKKGWPHFQEVFMLSALNGEEVRTLKKYLMTLAKPSEWEYHSEVITTQTPQEICNNIIREKLLEYLPQEIPYNVIQNTELWEEGPSGELSILQTLLVQKENHVKILIGPGGQIISKVAQEAGRDLMNVFLCDVHLRLSVKLKK